MIVKVVKKIEPNNVGPEKIIGPSLKYRKVYNLSEYYGDYFFFEDPIKQIYGLIKKKIGERSRYKYYHFINGVILIVTKNINDIVNYLKKYKFNKFHKVVYLSDIKRQNLSYYINWDREVVLINFGEYSFPLFKIREELEGDLVLEINQDLIKKMKKKGDNEKLKILKSLIMKLDKKNNLHRFL